MCKYTFLLATIKVLEKFLEAILWKPFQLFRRILIYVSSIKSVVISMLISVEGTGKSA